MCISELCIGEARQATGTKGTNVSATRTLQGTAAKKLEGRMVVNYGIIY